MGFASWASTLPFSGVLLALQISLALLFRCYCIALVSFSFGVLFYFAFLCSANRKIVTMKIYLVSAAVVILQRTTLNFFCATTQAFTFFVGQFIGFVDRFTVASLTSFCTKTVIATQIFHRFNSTTSKQSAKNCYPCWSFKSIHT
ncbi:hypothetical protein B9Z33_10330 [Limnohabitans sp. T6-20]|nr:hypothetical protein B9Z33_10330 [Limnohabitans sp. T6-20]